MLRTYIYNQPRCIEVLALAGIVLLTGTALTSTARAGTASDSFQVTATVPDSCIVDANDLAFGNYNPLSGSVLNGSTTLNVTCTSGTGYNVGLNQGAGPGATVAARKMSNGGNSLVYSLYQEASYSSVWGNSIGSNTVSNTGTGAVQTLTVYGQIAASQSVPPGSYSDTITVTVTF